MMLSRWLSASRTASLCSSQRGMPSTERASGRAGSQVLFRFISTARCSAALCSYLQVCSKYIRRPSRCSLCSLICSARSAQNSEYDSPLRKSWILEKRSSSRMNASPFRKYLASRIFQNNIIILCSCKNLDEHRLALADNGLGIILLYQAINIAVDINRLNLRDRLVAKIVFQFFQRIP